MLKKFKRSNLDEKTKIKFLNYLAIFFWTVIISLSYFWNYTKTSNQIIELAKVCARGVIDKDISFYKTIAEYGGVFVADKETLKKYRNLIDEETILTDKDDKFTFMHPIEIILKSNKNLESINKIKEHLTSLNPMKVKNKPDKWEESALKSFEKGAKEQYCIVNKNETHMLKLIRPCLTEKGCLRCHGKDGYKIGDVRGGITVSVPMTPYENAKLKDKKYIYYSHLMLWFIGITGIFYGEKKVFKWFINFKKSEKRENDLKIAFAKKDKNDSLNRMTGAIAHNVNNLLTAILGNIDMAENVEIENKEVEEYLSAAKGASMRAAELTKKMSLYIGGIHTVRNMLNFSKLVKSTVRDIKGNEKIDLKMEKESLFVNGDLNQILKVIEALIENALESGNGNSKVNIEIGEQVNDGSLKNGVIDIDYNEHKYIYFQIEDNGKGIDEKELKNIFDPFYSTKFTGRGIGLAIVYGVVKAHNGQIFVESEKEKGTKIKILLPSYKEN